MKEPGVVTESPDEKLLRVGGVFVLVVAVLGRFAFS
jgi:hypothetical protein